MSIRLTPAPSRRDFLRTTGTGLAAAPFVLPTLGAASDGPRAAASVSAPAAPAADARATGQPFPDLESPLPLAPEQKVGWAIVGLGAFALNQILPAIGRTRRCRLAALVSGNAEKARAVGQAYGVRPDRIYSYDTFDRIAQADDVDVVYVVLPNALHRPWTERALAAGKHVFCEKPMAPTEADCQAMIDAADRAGKKLLIAYRAHFEPHNVRARELIREGAIGTPQLVTSSHGRILNLDHQRDKWRAKEELAGGGSLFDIGIYGLNGAMMMLGEEPTEVLATWTAPEDERPEVNVETGVRWSMRFPSGAEAHMASSYAIQQNKHIDVSGSEGRLLLNPATDYYHNALYRSREAGTERIVLSATEQFTGELDHMAEVVKDGAEPKVPASMGLRDVRLMQAIYASARTGRPVSV